ALPISGAGAGRAQGGGGVGGGAAGIRAAEDGVGEGCRDREAAVAAVVGGGGEEAGAHRGAQRCREGARRASQRPRAGAVGEAARGDVAEGAFRGAAEGSR